MPPIAASVRIAFSNASRTRIFDSTRSSCTIATIRRPAMRASSLRRASTAGIAALVGSPTPSASTIDAIEEAVPIVMQCPALRFMPASASWNSLIVISPARSCSLIEMMLVPEPILRP